MVILHIANIGKDMANGVHVAVPGHIKAQANLAQVCLVNIRNINVMGDMQCEYKGAESFPEYLPEPFNKPDIAIFHEVNYIEYIRLYKQLLKTLDELEVKPIEAVGQPFDPNFHNAVMHVEDEAYGENEVVEELQKGYMYRDTVVRHSMVKVAN